MSRHYEERYYVKDEREIPEDYEEHRRSSSRARSSSRHNSRHRQPQDDQYSGYRQKMTRSGSGSSMSSVSDFEGQGSERPLVRCPRDVIRAPTPPPVIQRVVERAPTPEADIVERVIVRPQPQQLIERIIERPRTPPPKIIDKEICEPAPPPIVRTRIVKVDDTPRHYYNQTQPTTQRYDGYAEDYYGPGYSTSYSTTEVLPAQAYSTTTRQGANYQTQPSAYQSQASGYQGHSSGYQGQASAYQGQASGYQAPSSNQQYYSQTGTNPYGYSYGYSNGQTSRQPQARGYEQQYNQRQY